MAVDSAVMVLDSAKGIETQTKKLFVVCRTRGIPILTFINKMDQIGRHPFELLDEIEQTLALTTVPMNWPIGEGPSFQGLYDFREQHVLFFQRTAHNERRAPMYVEAFSHPSLQATLGDAYGPLQEEIALLKGAGASFDRKRFLAVELTPVFFGSALTNFGVVTNLSKSIIPSSRCSLGLKPCTNEYSSTSECVERQGLGCAGNVIAESG